VGHPIDNTHAQAIDVGNSGTTLFLGLAVASLASFPVTFTGDSQIHRRSAQHVLDALQGLGVKVSSSNGYVPITVQGPWHGGRVSIECPTSQYLSALLLAAPCASAVTEIEVPLLNEKPYVAMTCNYLNNQNIPYEHTEDWSFFRIPGGASYKAINGRVPADFSSAAFPAGAAALGGEPLTLEGLDYADVQGDKILFQWLEQMGCTVQWNGQKVTVSRHGTLRGGTFDLNAVPDLVPIMAVLCAYAEGESFLTNVRHARLKETDRIASMAAILTSLGADCEELSDGLHIHGGKTLHGRTVDGCGDHRIVMAVAIAALKATEAITITGSEAASVTYPGFWEMLVV
jgi:3-phosphoshikimate 1-carboxyvinyltransferase